MRKKRSASHRGSTSRVNGIVEATVTKQRSLIASVRTRLDQDLGGFHDSFDAIARRELCLDAIETPPPSSAVPALAAVLDKSLSVVTSTAAGAIAHQRERVRSLLNQLNCELSKQTEGAFRTLQMNEEKRVASQRHSFEKELALVKSAGLAEIESAKQRDAAMTTAKSRIELKVLTSQIEELEQSLREARTGSSAKMEELTYQLEAANRGMVEARSTAAAAVEEAEEARAEAEKLTKQLRRYTHHSSSKKEKKKDAGGGGGTGEERPMTAEQLAEVKEKVAEVVRAKTAETAAAKKSEMQANHRANKVVRTIQRHELTINGLHGRVHEASEEVHMWKAKYKVEKTRVNDMRIDLTEATRKFARQKTEHATQGGHASKYAGGLEDDVAVLSSQRAALTSKLKLVRAQVKTCKADCHAFRTEFDRGQRELTEVREHHALLQLHLLRIIDALLHGPAALSRFVHRLRAGRAAADALLSRRVEPPTREEQYRVAWAEMDRLPSAEAAAKLLGDETKEAADSSPSVESVAALVGAPASAPFAEPTRMVEAEIALESVLPQTRMRHLAPLLAALEGELRVQIEPSVRRKIEAEFREKTALRFQVLMEEAIETRLSQAISEAVAAAMRRHHWGREEWAVKFAEIEAKKIELERAAQVTKDSGRRIQHRLLQQAQDEVSKNMQITLASQEKDRLLSALVEKLRLTLVRLEEVSKKCTRTRAALAEESDAKHALEVALARERGHASPEREGRHAISTYVLSTLVRYCYAF